MLSGDTYKIVQDKTNGCCAQAPPTRLFGAVLRTYPGTGTRLFEVPAVETSFGYLRF